MNLKINPLIILLAFTACSGNHSHQDPGLTLNNGKKWHLNTEMLPLLDSIGILLDDYRQEPEGDWKQLGQAIELQTSRLIKSCTMSGPDHDMLHQWLHPFMEKTTELKLCKDSATAHKIVKDLQNSMKEFDRYFESQ